jgi:hypothetical protein
MNKIVLIIFLIVVTAVSAEAQLLPGGERQRFADDEKQIESGMFYARYAMKAPRMINEWGLEIGIGGGALATRNFSVGFGIHSLISKNIEIQFTENEQNPMLRLNYGGAELGYRFPLAEDFSFGAIALLGVGYTSYSTHVSVDVYDDLNGDWFLIAEPGIYLGWQFYETTILQLSGNYRIASGVDYKKALDAADLSGPVAAIGIKAFF